MREQAPKAHTEEVLDRRCRRDQRGATLPEYALVLAAVALIIVPLANWIQDRSGNRYTGQEAALSNADLAVPTPSPSGTTIPPVTTTTSVTTTTTIATTTTTLLPTTTTTSSTTTTSTTLAPDITPPPAPTVSGSSPKNNQVDLTFSNTEAGVTFECSVDGGAWSACTSPAHFQGNQYDGTHSYSVRSKDAAGNASQSTSVSVTA